MALGLAAKGLLEERDRSHSRRIAQGTLEVQQQQQAFASANKLLGDHSHVITDIINNHIARGGDVSDLQLAKAIQPLIQQGIQTFGAFDQANQGSNTVARFEGNVRAALTTPSVAEKGAVARGEASLDTAASSAAEAKAAVDTLPQTLEVERSKGDLQTELAIDKADATADPMLGS